MSLKTRSLVSVMVLSLIALVAACASEQRSPTSPTGPSSMSGINSVVEEYWVTLADEAPPLPGPGGNTGSWPPGPPPLAPPGVPVPTNPSTHPRVSIKIDPEPVLYSGTPITDVVSCRTLPHTWFYDVILHGETGVRVNVSERENFFGGRFTSKSGGFELGPNGTVVLHVRWCSGYPTFHYTQHRFKGTDEYGEKIEISTQWIRLYAAGTN